MIDEEILEKFCKQIGFVYDEDVLFPVIEEVNGDSDYFVKFMSIDATHDDQMGVVFRDYLQNHNCKFQDTPFKRPRSLFVRREDFIREFPYMEEDAL